MSFILYGQVPCLPVINQATAGGCHMNTMRAGEISIILNGE